MLLPFSKITTKRHACNIALTKAFNWLVWKVARIAFVVIRLQCNQKGAMSRTATSLALVTHQRNVVEGSSLAFTLVNTIIPAVLTGKITLSFFQLEAPLLSRLEERTRKLLLILLITSKAVLVRITSCLSSFFTCII